MTAQKREISVSWGTSTAIPGMRCLQVECDEELTQFMFMGPAVFDESNPAAIVAGPIAEMAVTDHTGRCTACSSWRAQA